MTDTTKQPDGESLDFVYEDKPTTPDPGWYAVLYAWDADEGIFCRSAYWDGQDWEIDRPIYAYAGPFLIEETAHQWAAKRDAIF